MTQTSPIDVTTYFRLLGKKVPTTTDYEHMEAYDPTDKDEHGIPVAVAQVSYEMADNIAKLYDTEYDKAKASFKQKGAEWNILTQGSDGQLVGGNLLQLVAGSTALRSAIRLTDENPLIALSVFHALLVKHEWVFSHLCEACNAIRLIPQVKANTGKQALDDFAEFASTAELALTQYRHRHA